jgi:hypothetical protein
VRVLAASDPADCTQTYVALLCASLTSYHSEAGGTHIGYGAFIPSEFAARGDRMLPAVSFALIFHIGLLVQILRL